MHGLGAAIHRAINLALQLRDTAPYTLSHHTTTSTVQLVDDLEPLTDVRKGQSHTVLVSLSNNVADFNL